MTFATMSESAAPSLKARVKRSPQSFPLLWDTYWRCKQEVRHLLLLRYFLHALLDLPVSQRIVMVIGCAPEGTDVPRSPRRALDDVLIPV